jgi:hypothetical protein
MKVELGEFKETGKKRRGKKRIFPLLAENQLLETSWPTIGIRDLG